MKYTLSSDYSKIFNNAVKAGMDYVSRARVGALVLGISGGIDSAVTAMLAHEVCANLTHEVQLIGRSLPIISNAPDEIVRAEKVGRAFCTQFATNDLTYAWYQLMEVIPNKSTETHLGKVNRGNVKARLRMIYLYSLAQQNRGLVLSTDNLTELLLGFWTLHGDVGDFGFIQQLWKTEVYGLANWYCKNILKDKKESPYYQALMSCVEAKPTDGLGVSNSDIDQLLPSMADGKVPWTWAYETIDHILMDYLNGKPLDAFTPAEQGVIMRYETTHFKRNNPYNIPRENLI